MLDHQPPSFYVSFPLRTLVVHPYEPDFSNELLPKLHAELWSDWFRVIHRQSPTRLERVTASSQSVLGFVGDALALGGLCALAIPGALRVLRRRSRAPADVGLGVLALLALVSFAAFVVTLIRFPQQYGDPIKSSYLLFTTPAWAVFSVAAWAALLRHKRLGIALIAVAGLYAVSYAADLGAALSQPTGPRQIGGNAGFVDLSAGIQQNSPNPGLGGTIDFLTGVTNTGDQTATNVVLTVKLPSGMRLLGPPFYERGSGCTGSTTIVCDLDFLAGGSSTLIRYSVQVTGAGPQTVDGDRLEHESRRAPRRQHGQLHGRARAGLKPGPQLGENTLVELGRVLEEAEQQAELLVGVTRVEQLGHPHQRLVERPELLVRLLGQRDVDAPPVALVARPLSEAGALEPVEHRRDRTGRQPHQLGEPPCGRAALLLDDVEAALVRAVEPDRIRDGLVVGVGAVL